MIIGMFPTISMTANKTINAVNISLILKFIISLFRVAKVEN
jgi:hypothetical protein